MGQVRDRVFVFGIDLALEAFATGVVPGSNLPNPSRNEKRKPMPGTLPAEWVVKSGADSDRAPELLDDPLDKHQSTRPLSGDADESEILAHFGLG